MTMATSHTSDRNMFVVPGNKLVHELPNNVLELIQANLLKTP
jgi:hypothetical protein